MSEQGFKKYIEERTASEVMADYSEQHDEWQVLKIVRNGEVVYPRNDADTEADE